jgi:hypothetical protein
MYYQNQTILLATKHQKEQAIAKPFYHRLSCTLMVHDFDTDQFGTFTGEVERKSNPYATCIEKARSAAAYFDYPFAIASEGSFGPHPMIPLIPGAHEMMVFIDLEHQWIISEQVLSQNTNYAMITIDAKTELETFLNQVGFPSHGLTLQYAKDKRVLAKGITNHVTLDLALREGFKHEQKLLLATDMRAMMNPTRMAMIHELADKLALRISNLCHHCQAPGFGFKKIQGQLPCQTCGGPSSYYKEEIWGCIQCEYQEYKTRSDGLIEADPRYCLVCNP